MCEIQDWDTVRDVGYRMQEQGSAGIHREQNFPPAPSSLSNSHLCTPGSSLERSQAPQNPTLAGIPTPPGPAPQVFLVFLQLPDLGKMPGFLGKWDWDAWAFLRAEELQIHIPFLTKIHVFTPYSHSQVVSLSSQILSFQPSTPTHSQNPRGMLSDFQLDKANSM